MSGSRPVPERGYNSASSDVISLRNRLEELIEDFATERETFDPSTVHGRIYTASSIDYDSDSSLVQTASSPSYWGVSGRLPAVNTICGRNTFSTDISKRLTLVFSVQLNRCSSSPARGRPTQIDPTGLNNGGDGSRALRWSRMRFKEWTTTVGSYYNREKKCGRIEYRLRARPNTSGPGNTGIVTLLPVAET